MFYLLLAILSSTGVSLFLRLSKKYSNNNYSLLAMNYLMCILLSSQFHIDTLLIRNDFPITITLSIISGILFMISFVYLQRNIMSNGLVYSSLFSKLGLLVPLCISVLFFHEALTLISTIGIIIAIAGIIFLNQTEEHISNFKSLLFLLFISGFTDSQSKIFSEFGQSSNSDAYLFYTFFFALLTSLLFVYLRKQKITKYDLLFGFMIGIPNYYSARFLLASLHSLDALFVYPIYSVGTILTISLCGILFFKEKLSKQSIIAYVMMLVSIALLNM